ncbi:MAG: hypothetical protein U0M12_07915 [Acutalibacteraceae bacterium]|nr:hypothetical protein [Acutalibacteraceae bacterium]
MREVIYWAIGMVMGANLGVLIMSLFKASDTCTNKDGINHKLAVQSEYCPVKTCKPEKTYDDLVNEEKNAFKLLRGELIINELSFEERINHTIYYKAALRYSIDCKNKEEYNKIFDVLQSDINRISDEELKIEFQIFYDRTKSYFTLGN